LRDKTGIVQLKKLTGQIFCCRILTLVSTPPLPLTINKRFDPICFPCRLVILPEWQGVREIFQAFCRAKELGLEKMQDSRDSGLLWCCDALEQQMALNGRDPVPYSVKKIRPTVQTFVDLSVEQGLIPSPLRIDDLFSGIYRVGKTQRRFLYSSAASRIDFAMAG
jgi:hypothetical protein